MRLRFFTSFEYISVYIKTNNFMKRKSTRRRFPLSPLPSVSFLPTPDQLHEKPKEFPQPPAPPSEEMVARLNALVQEYPFCTHYHEKEHDPL